jgi:phosphoglycerate dehydrogenase-like enzyme
MTDAPFRLGLTRDFLEPDGSLAFGDIGLDLLGTNPRLVWEFLPEHHAEIPPQVADRYDALLVLTPRVTATTLQGAGRLILIARFGVGYDSVDVDACTRNDVLLTITPEGVRRPVAASALALLLALSHKLLIKDRLTRQGRWAEKTRHMGTGLTGRTLGVVGLGNIGREVCALSRPLDMRLLASDPHVTPDTSLGIELLSLEDLLRAADFVIVCCALTPQTRHLLNAERLALMKPTAYLINVARGGIVDQRALTEALRQGRLQGAGLDVFEQEPIAPDDPLLEMDNVILAPHALCWTDELFRANGRDACQSVLDVAEGRAPRHVVNRAALDRLGLLEKLRRHRRQGDV